MTGYQIRVPQRGNKTSRKGFDNTRKHFNKMQMFLSILHLVYNFKYSIVH